MRRALSLMSLALAGGCSYAQQRALDFGDIWKLEFSFGPGLQAYANAGELAHVGVGSSRRFLFGPRYGSFDHRFVVEDHLPLSFVWTLSNPSQPHLHRVLVEGREQETHHGFILLPGEINGDEWDTRAVHYFDVAAGAHVVSFGAEAGVSVGELVDWIFGWFKFSDRWTWLDPAGDDLPDQRDRRSFYEKRARELGSPLKPPVKP